MAAICPGGLMACSSVEVVRAAGGDGPDIHTDAPLMAQVARGIARETGFDNVGVPFCMTVEAEALGAKVDLGDGHVAPIVTGHVFDTLRDVCTMPQRDLPAHGRMGVVLGALEVLAGDERVVIGNLTGPLSLLVSLVEPSVVYEAMRINPRVVAAALDRMTEALLEFGAAMIEAGADVLMIAEPSGACGVLEATRFPQFVEAPLTELTSSFIPRVDVLVHVCGDVYPILRSLRRIPMSAFSFDSAVPAQQLRAAWPDAVLVGNLSTHVLHERAASDIAKETAGLVWRGVDIVAPACGIAAETPAANLRAMTQAAREVRGQPPSHLA